MRWESRNNSFRLICGQAAHRNKFAYNAAHGVVPQAIKKKIADSLKTIYETAEETVELAFAEEGEDYDVHEAIRQLEQEMLEAASALEFERAAVLRDQIKTLKEEK